MILVLGSTNLDLVGGVPHLPRPGETVLGGRFSAVPGGKGANQALAACRGGGEVAFFGATGADSQSEAALALLRDGGVDLSGVTTADAATGVALILVDAAGENSIAVLPGANLSVTEAHVAAAMARARSGDVLVLQQEVPEETNRLALERARARGLRSLLNIAPYREGTREVAGLADILIANETEFAALAGLAAPDLAPGGALDEALADWTRRTDQTVIVTLGGAGARISRSGQVTRVPAPKVEVVDTVGAGDTFCGYLAAGLDRGLTLEAAADLAIRAASLACTRPGAQTGIPNLDELDQA